MMQFILGTVIKSIKGLEAIISGLDARVRVINNEIVKTDKLLSLDSIVPLDESHELIVDDTSLIYVIGTEIDYEQKLGSSSLVIKNPNESSSCGCGKSFSVG